MSLFAEFLIALEYARSTDERTVSQQWRGCSAQFLGRRWISHDGHLTAIVVNVHGGEDEVDVVVDEAAGTFSYRSPDMRARTITRPLADIAIYVPNLDAWFDDVTT